MPDFTAIDEPKTAPKPAIVKPKYTETDYLYANNTILINIEQHLKSIRSMLTFFVTNDNIIHCAGSM